jgi:hypothetical protein
MNTRRTTAGAPRPNVALARTDEGHELAPQARAGATAPLVAAVRPC